jgi:hypothetical protein
MVAYPTPFVLTWSLEVSAELTSRVRAEEIAEEGLCACALRQWRAAGDWDTIHESRDTSTVVVAHKVGALACTSRTAVDTRTIMYRYSNLDLRLINSFVFTTVLHSWLHCEAVCSV